MERELGQRIADLDADCLFMAMCNSVNWMKGFANYPNAEYGAFAPTVAAAVGYAAMYCVKRGDEEFDGPYGFADAIRWRLSGHQKTAPHLVPVGPGWVAYVEGEREAEAFLASPPRKDVFEWYGPEKRDVHQRMGLAN